MNNSKNSVRTLTMLALLVAMSIVFSRVLSISTGFVRFNLGSLPALLAALLFGPGAGFAVGAVADMIGGVLAGYAINPLITLGAGAIGLVAGLAWQKLPGLRTGLRLQISVLLGHFVGSMVITSLALRIFYGYPWATLAVRIPNALILAAVNTVLLRILLENRALMKMVKKYKLPAQSIVALGRLIWLLQKASPPNMYSFARTNRRPVCKANAACSARQGLRYFRGAGGTNQGLLALDNPKAVGLHTKNPSRYAKGFFVLRRFRVAARQPQADSSICS